MLKIRYKNSSKWWLLLALCPSIAFSNCEIVDRHDTILDRLFFSGDTNKNIDCTDRFEKTRARSKLDTNYFSKPIDDIQFRENWTLMAGSSDLGNRQSLTKANDDYGISQPTRPDTDGDFPTASGYKSRTGSE